MTWGRREHFPGRGKDIGKDLEARSSLLCLEESQVIPKDCLGGGGEGREVYVEVRRTEKSGRAQPEYLSLILRAMWNLKSGASDVVRNAFSRGQS